jgi:hypothetical protein
MMNEYEVGRDLQELRSRVQALEGGPHEHAVERFAVGRMEKFRVAPGIDPQVKPIIWKQQKDAHLPPFVNRMLDLHPSLKLDAAQSHTWSCTPEPLIITVNWNAGGADEFFRLQNQSFTILRATDPNTGITSASGVYEARLIASGRANNTNDHTDGPLYFDITLRNAQGGPLGSPGTYPGNIVWVSCRDNLDLSIGGAFNPGLYDLVAGANWDIPGFRVHGC